MEKKYEYVRRTLTWEGKRYTVRGKTEREAADKLAELRASLRRGERTVGADSTVDRWFEEWYALYKCDAGITDKSRKMYREKYDLYISPRIGVMKLKDVREVHLQRILNSQRGRSFSLLSKLRLVLRAIFSRAHSTRLIPFDPSCNLSLPDCTKGTHRSITEEERLAILTVAGSHPSGLWVMLILHAGLRPGETAPLQWQDIDLTHGVIHVYKALESGSSRIKDPKTDAGTRDIPISRTLLPLLQSARQGHSPLDLVFPTSGGKMRDDKALRRLWSGFTRSLDIHMGATLYRNRIIESVVADDLTPYCLRHTFCTDLERAGVPINVAKELMGHSDISVTANIYTHRDPGVLRRGIAQLDASRETVTVSLVSDTIFIFSFPDSPSRFRPSSVTFYLSPPENLSHHLSHPNPQKPAKTRTS